MTRKELTTSSPMRERMMTHLSTRPAGTRLHAAFWAFLIRIMAALFPLQPSNLYSIPSRW